MALQHRRRQADVARKVVVERERDRRRVTGTVVPHSLHDALGGHDAVVAAEMAQVRVEQIRRMWRHDLEVTVAGSIGDGVVHQHQPA